MQSRRTVRRGTDWGYVARIVVVAIVVLVLLLAVVPWLWDEIRGPQIVLTDLEVNSEFTLAGNEVKIGFSLHNTGSSGTATVEFTEDDQVIGTNSYFVSGGQSRRVKGTFMRDFGQHYYGARIISVTRG